MTARLRVGMGDSYGLSFAVLAATDFAPADVTAATFKVTKPTATGESSVEWTGSLSAQSAAGVTANYTFNADGLDLDYPGAWRVWIQWTVVGESPGPRTEVARFTVIAADAV